MSARAKKKRKPDFRVGEKVAIRLGGRLLHGVIIEDRGNLGPGGTRLLRVEVKAKENAADRDAGQFEVPAEALVPA